MNLLSRAARLSLVVTLAFVACGQTKQARRYSAQEAAQATKKLEVVGLELGEFAVDGSNSVIDGDTIRVTGLDASLRLLALDAEETFKRESERAAYAGGWEAYKKAVRGDSARPVKYPTPLGEDAKHWAQELFQGVQKVRLERDHPGEIRDYFGRYLAYVFVEKGGAWVNFNVECVRMGLSPYFTKYGRSRRFHHEFLAAQDEAQKAQRGIWDPAKEHYDDYPERLAWWNAREVAITRFEKRADESPDDHFLLTRWDALKRLEERMGREVTVLGSVNEIREKGKGPTVVKLGRSRGNDFEVVFFDRDVFLSSGIAKAKGEYVQVRGLVQRYVDKRRQMPRLQIVVGLPGQVLTPSPELDEMLERAPKTSAAEAD